MLPEVRSEHVRTLVYSVSILRSAQFIFRQIQTMFYFKSFKFFCFFRDGGGTITTVELGQVMTTFGWTPTEPELQELIGEK